MSAISTPNSVRSITRSVRRAIIRRDAMNRVGPLLIGAMGVSAFIVLIDRLWTNTIEMWWMIPVAMGICAIVWGGIGAIRKAPDATRSAGVLDDRLKLNSRLRASLELRSDDENAGFVELAMRDADTLASSVNPNAALHDPRTTSYWYAGLVGLVCIAIGIWVPARTMTNLAPRPVPPTRAMAEIEIAEENAREIQEDEGTPEAVREQFEELEELKNELAQGVTDEQEADARTAAKLEEIADTMEQSASDAQEQADSIRESIESLMNQKQAAQESWDPRVEEFAESLEQQDFAEAAEQIEELNDAMESMTPEEREQISEQLEELANAIDPEDLEDPAEESSASEPDLGDAMREQAERMREQPEPETQPESPAEQQPESQEQNEREGSSESESESQGGESQEQETREQEGKQREETGSQEQQGSEQPREEQGNEQSGQEQSGSEQGEEQRPQSSEHQNQEQSEDQPGAESQTEQGETPQDGQEQRRESGEEPGNEGEQREVESTQDPEGTAPREQSAEEQGGENPQQEQSPRQGESLEERLREMERQQRQSQRQRERADELRRQAERLMDPDQQQDPGEGMQRMPEQTRPPELSEGGGDGERDPDTPDLERSGEDAEYVPVDVRDQENNAGGQPIGEWYAPDGEPVPPGTNEQTAQRFRRASQQAQKAVDEQQVPRRYRHLIREVFQRVQDRADEMDGAGAIAPQGQDAVPSNQKSEGSGQGG